MRRIRDQRPLARIISVDSYKRRLQRGGRRRLECIRAKEVVNTIKEGKFSAIFNLQAISLQQNSQHSNNTLSTYNLPKTQILKMKATLFTLLSTTATAVSAAVKLITA